MSLSEEMSGACTVVPAVAGAWPLAQRVADQLNCRAVRLADEARSPVALFVDYDDLWLQKCMAEQVSPVRVDFASPGLQYRRKSGQNELLGRAVGVKGDTRPLVLDATAGLGRDAYVLADLGCSVTLIERSPVLALMLKQALERASISAITSVQLASSRMQLQSGDSRAYKISQETVIYLDPMFTDRRSSAAVKKDLSVLQALHASVENEDEQLFVWAMSQPVRRVVVKRPLKSPALHHRKPSHVIKGKAVRFDVYVL
ncbi:MAG: class I SAM-dependent methyltransferase [Luminiphilus sp.]|nr:class I SAM-dependent methyltransferase [Luminiphilus sp.]MDG1460964.1 class I SAM-dependent methyltransferase [Luminiphilus sp.]